VVILRTFCEELEQFVIFCYEISRKNYGKEILEIDTYGVYLRLVITMGLNSKLCTSKIRTFKNTL
jgi:hypothetical protein